MTSELDVKEPQLPRRRKVPLRYESGKAPAEYHSTPKVYYRQIFYEALDLITQAIESRFDHLDIEHIDAWKILSSKLLTRKTIVKN